MSTFLAAKTRNIYLVFYPLAALWACLGVPLWIAQYLGELNLAVTAQHHAHEMIFGFGLAVITGFLLNGCKRWELLLLSLLWILARFIPFIPVETGIWTLSTSLAYTFYLAWLAALPLFKNAKSWRNLAFAPILCTFSLGEILYFLVPEKGLLLGLNLICAMIFMMGGRVVTAITNGFIQRMGDHLKPGAQSYWEEKGFFALLVLIVGELAEVSLLSLAGGLSFSFVLGMRLYRWQPWRLWANPQVIWLHIGFGWLLVGVLLRMAGKFWEDSYTELGIHLITIAALGTLSLSVMTRSTLQRLRFPISCPKALFFALALINLALLARIAMVLADDIWIWSILSSVSYAQAYLIFFIWFFLTVRQK